MIRIGNMVASFTNPSTDMMLGIAYQRSEGFDMEGNKIMDADIFSIGLFIARIDIFFNFEATEDEAI